MPPVKMSQTTASNTASRSPGTGTFGSYTPKLNDLILCWTCATTVAAITDTATWVNVLGANTVVASDSHTQCCLYHLVTAAEELAVTTSWTLTNLFNSAISGNAVTIAIRGADPTNPINTTGTLFDSANSATPWIMAGTLGVNVLTEAWLMSCLCGSITNSLGAAPSGWTFLTSSNTNQLQAAFSKNVLMTRGTDVGTQNMTPTTGDEYASITVVLTSLRQLSPPKYLNPPMTRAGFH